MLHCELESNVMNGYITVQEAAIKWNVTDRQIQLWYKAGKVKDSVMLSRIWIIPEDAEKPVSKRLSASKNATVLRNEGIYGNHREQKKAQEDN